MMEQRLERDPVYDQEFARAIQVIEKHNDFILTTHINPDGDGLGCESALFLALTGMGKKVTVVNANATPALYDFLPHRDAFNVETRHTQHHEVAIFLECPDEQRAGEVIDISRGASHVINIDHHVFNSRFGTVNLIDPTAAAAGEQVWDLLGGLKCRLDNLMAIGIYTAIATDTGHFKYAGVTPRTHRIIAQLLELGVKPDYMNEQLYERVPLEGLHLLAMSLSWVRHNARHNVGWFSVTQDMITATGAKESNTENFVNYVRAVKGVEVAAFFLETHEGKTKISFRSRGKIDVSIIARQLGGGGHQRAAGVLLSESLESAQAHVLAEIEKRVNGKV